MTLTPSQWKAIENESVFCDVAVGRTIQAIELGKLRTIIKKSRRSTDQNALLWALYDDAKKLGGELLGGWDTETIHDYMLGEYFGWVTSEALGRKRQTPARRSSRLSKTEFADFLEFVVRRFAEHGIVLQLPGETC